MVLTPFTLGSYKRHLCNNSPGRKHDPRRESGSQNRLVGAISKTKPLWLIFALSLETDGVESRKDGARRKKKVVCGGGEICSDPIVLGVPFASQVIYTLFSHLTSPHLP